MTEALTLQEADTNEDSGDESGTSEKNKVERSRSRSQERVVTKSREEANHQNEQPEDKRQKLWTAKSDTQKKAMKWTSSELNSEDQMKFLKLMGVKGGEVNKTEKKLIEEPNKKLFAGFGPKKDLNSNLEEQYHTALLRKDGRKNGLGFGH
eukprot:CAMPEP_0176438228 /NCGR_PEP_ID=MMETSP0127-20121128/19148_1 /TAXON_ID=938130 /ORGANISM="Platyophrya macrostoma, Strain WH" /LENGTH=150 /DNA_ID=CAMNT_0017822117 /DNA_START=324 /DNA_END=776 /DNA_ORIENTATION=-